MRFFAFLFMGIAFGLGTHACAEEEAPVNIQSVTGIGFQAATDEVRKAYLSLADRKSKNAERLSPLADGSVAVIKPFFEYDGKKYRIDGNGLSAEGICHRFGFEKKVGHEIETIPGKSGAVVLDEDGKLKDVHQPVEEFPELYKKVVLRTVACHE